MDAVAAIYRLSAAASEFAYPLGFRWYRATPMDAALELTDGRRIAVVCQGRTADRTAFTKRIRRLRETPGFAAVLLLAPDETRLRHTRRLVSGPPVITFLALERDVALSGADADIWRGPSGSARLTLREALSFAVPALGGYTERPLARVSMPEPLDPSAVARPWLMPAVFSAAEKRTLELVADWPWIRPLHLSGLLGVGKRRLSQLLCRLDEFGLVTPGGQAGHPRMALSDRGLACVARRDRTSVGIARNRWSAQPREQSQPHDWRNVSGIRSRQLLRNLEHTESVHWFGALLAAQAREQSFQLVQFDPPHRASRYFRYQERMRSIHPDAFGLLRTAEGDRAWFVEWERRAVRPATMAARLAPYLRYYATRRPIDDHGIVPNVLVVFEDQLTATHFLRLAERAMTRAQVTVPLLVSDRQSLDDAGPLDAVWRSAERYAPARPY